MQSLDIEACDLPLLDNEFIPCLLYADDIVLLSVSRGTSAYLEYLTPLL